MLNHLTHGRVHPVLNRIVNIAILCGVIWFAAALGIQVADYSLPVTILDQKVLTKQVRIGDDFRYWVKFIPLRRCNTHTDRAIEDKAGQRFQLAPIDYETQLSVAGIEQEYTTVIPLTADNLNISDLSVLKPGPAKLISLTTYRCNFIQNWWPTVGPVRTREFEILPAQPVEKSDSTAPASSARTTITVDLGGQIIDPSKVSITLGEVEQ